MENNIFFTADTHFGHNNIIKFTKRPFVSIDEMNNKLIENWNAKVAPNDEIYHLGDVALMSGQTLTPILEKLNGKIYLIKGNHEVAALQNEKKFEWVKDYHELIVKDTDAHRGERLIVLFHYAMRVWNASHHGSWHLYGHSHGTLPDDITSLSFDAGIDCHHYAPISYEEVKTIMAKKQWKNPFPA